MRKIFAWPLLLITICSGCYKESDYDFSNIEPARIISDFRSEKTSLLANGAEESKISVELPGDIREEYSMVKFKTSGGTFVESGKAETEVTARITVEGGIKKRVATATLRNGLVEGKILIEAGVKNVSRSIEIFSVNSPPSQIRIVPSALFMNAGYAGELTIKTLLAAPSGKVTPGQLVSLQLQDPSGSSKGSFRVVENRSNQDGECSFIYTLLPDTAYTGLLTIKASTVTPKGLLSESLNISIIKK